jgi:hypothetical protein
MALTAVQGGAVIVLGTVRPAVGAMFMAAVRVHTPAILPGAAPVAQEAPA